METTKKRSQYFKYIRYLHRILAPIMLLPLLLTTITGVAYQILELTGNQKNFKWILGWHKGAFGVINLESIYPFLTAIGLLILIFTGISMWRTMRRTSSKPAT